MSAVDLSIVMPCLNEAQTLGRCIAKARRWAQGSGLEVEVLVADNGSTDGSQAIATGLGARVVPVSQRGYGSALYHGSQAAAGRWIVMGDSDDSYDFSRLDAFVERLRAGDELVMGNRFRGGIAPGAMPWKNRHIGNPILTWIGRVLFDCPARDFHCGLRAYTRDAFQRMDLRTTGMEFASEMLIKATLLGMRVSEVPTTLDRDGRSRPPHLRPWRDGWRHLRFMLLFSPRWLFLHPGAAVFLASAIAYVALLFGPVRVGRVAFDVHTLFYAEAGVILGLLAAILGVATRMFAVREGLLRDHVFFERIRTSPVFEVGGFLGGAMMLGGIVWGLRALLAWGSVSFGALTPGTLLRTISFSTTLIVVGGEVVLGSFIFGFLSLPTRGQR